jgi:hypothetical protein
MLDDECLEIKPMGKGKQPSAAGAVEEHFMPVVVRVEFEHFFNLLWYCSKIEHAVKMMARCWAEDAVEAQVGDGGRGDADDCDEAESEGACSNYNAQQGKKAAKGDEGGGMNMQFLCERFSKECEGTISEMHQAFLHGHVHVLESIYACECMGDVNSSEEEEEEDGEDDDNSEDDDSKGCEKDAAPRTTKVGTTSSAVKKEKECLLKSNGCKKKSVGQQKKNPTPSQIACISGSSDSDDDDDGPGMSDSD